MVFGMYFFIITKCLQKRSLFVLFYRAMYKGRDCYLNCKIFDCELFYVVICKNMSIFALHWFTSFCDSQNVIKREFRASRKQSRCCKFEISYVLIGCNFNATDNLGRHVQRKNKSEDLPVFTQLTFTLEERVQSLWSTLQHF